MVDTLQNLLRPAQVDETKDEVARIEGMLGDPKAQIEDRPLAQKQLNNMKKVLHEQTPTPFDDAAIDAAIKTEKELREQMIGDGMPTQAEMRKCPPGAVEKLRSWENRNKTRMQNWKYLRQRINAETTDPDVANFEKFRPTGGAAELSMDNAVIAGKQYRLPPSGAGPVVVMSAKESAALKELDPEVHDMMAMATNDQRAEILDFVRGVMVTKKEPEAVAKPEPHKNLKRKLSQKQLNAMAAGRKKAKAKRDAAAQVVK